MKNPPGVLARLFGRAKPAPVVSSLAMCALSRPLLIAPGMAQALIAGYLSGEITSADTEMAAERVSLAPPSPEQASVGTVGVINISGGLVNRPMPGASGAGPVSYTALRNAFDELLHDESVTAIVLRVESPGGMASGLFDLADHIYASRGQKPIHALVDDYAYSAAFGIIAACDERWISRTGAVGSVGTKSEHYDWSGYNEQIGLKVTPVYAGERKVDFSPNAPLSPEAKAELQADIDDLNRLFIQSVARYIGMEVEAVAATEAATYQGARALDVGLATRLGTWDDLIAHLGAPGVDAPEQAGDDGEDDGETELHAVALTAGTDTTAPTENIADGNPDTAPAHAAADAAALALEADTSAAATEAATEAAKNAAAGQIATAVRAAGLAPDLTIALMDYIQTPEAVEIEVKRAQGIADLCRAGGLRSVAADLIKSGVTVEQARAQLDGATASVGDELVTAQPTQNTAVVTAAAKQAQSLDPNHVYANRSKNRGSKK